jgi:Pyruvate/2-oxoacid:ferredoxin oxidoreductase delta subunit
MKLKRKIIEIDEAKCNGCGQCVEACAEGAIKLVDGRAKLVADNYCDGLAACVGDCPVDALKIVEREADAFDPEAVEHHLKQLQAPDPQPPAEASMHRGCPSTKMEMFASPCQAANQPVIQASSDSTLTHWPIQIRLVPPFAPFLQRAHLLVASDCTPFAYPDFHKDFLEGRAVLVGCPKFDDTESYVSKFTEIFKVADIQSVTILIMEVPCCSKMPIIVQEGMARAGKNIPTEFVVVSARGKIVRRDKLAA